MTQEPTRPRKRFYRRLWFWLVAPVVGLLAATVTSIEVTSRSSFCNRCHIMNSYYASWHTDTHSDVPCVECHIAPGMNNFVLAKLNGLGQVVDDWLNRTSTKPSASVSDFACTRPGCHVVADLSADGNPQRPYFFNHAKHLNIGFRGIDIHCTTCHSHVKGNRHFEVNTNTCVTCHLLPPLRRHAAEAAAANGTVVASAMVAAANPGAEAAADTGGEALASALAAGSGVSVKDLAPSSCVTCHAPPDHPIQYHGLTVDHKEFQQFGAGCESCHRGATAPPRPVGDSQCVQCHDFGAERITTPTEMHRIHTEGSHKVECFSCHGVTRHGPSAQAMSLGEFDCRSCHAGQHNVQRGTYLFDSVPPGRPAHQPVAQQVVSPMFLVHVDCTGCHIEPRPVSVKPDSGATVKRAVPAACDACHRAGMGEQMIPLWQRTTHQLYDEVEAMLPTAADPWADDVPAALASVNQARGLLELIRVDGSWGVHNPLYTQQVIEQARQKVVEARRLVPAPAPAPEDKPEPGAPSP